MNQANAHNFRVLAVAVSTRGFGYAILEGRDVLVNWGVLSATTDSLPVIQDMIAKYQVSTVVMESKSYKSSKIRLLAKWVTALATKCDVKLLLLTRHEVRSAFFGDAKGNRYKIAEILAEQFPEELGFRLPPDRACWKGEDSRMCLFDAIGIAIACQVTIRRGIGPNTALKSQ